MDDNDPKDDVDYNPREARVEAMARIVAAQQMALVKDPLGERLQPGFWRRYIARCDLILGLINWNAP